MSRVVAITAHPDDETIFAGGTLAKLASEGHEVIIISTTRGEGGEVGEPPLCLKEQLGPFREAELRCAAAALGAKRVIFMGFVDPWIDVGEEGKATDVPLKQFSAAIADQLAVLRPDIVITHGSGGEYGHPQHIYTHQAVRRAVAGLKAHNRMELLTWMANPGDAPAGDRLVNRDDPADLVIDVTPWLDAKGAALDCHRTQHAMIRRHSKLPNVRDTLRHIEALRRWG